MLNTGSDIKFTLKIGSESKKKTHKSFENLFERKLLWRFISFENCGKHCEGCAIN